MPINTTAGYIGLKDANSFDFATAMGINTFPPVSPWTSLPPMHDRRRYPTVTALSGSEMLVVSGQMYGTSVSTVPEVYSPALRIRGGD